MSKYFKYTEAPEPVCGCGAVVGQCDCVDRATEPEWYAPARPIIFDVGHGMTTEDVDQAVRQVRCGYCGNNGTGISNPECPKPIHRRAS